MKVIIPSAKLVPTELQTIGKIPAIIYPINQNISFDFFKMKYDSAVSEIDIICFENADKVREKLAGYKLTTKLKFIELDELKDLGYSVHSGLTDEDEEIIIHFADTIIMDNLPVEYKNLFCSSQDYLNETWTFYKIQNGEIVSVNDKKTPSAPFVESDGKYNFFVGFFKISDGAYFKKCLEYALKDSLKGVDSFYSALIQYSQRYKFHSYEVKDWFDIGHSQAYFKTRMQVESRIFNHIDIDQDRGILKKTSTNTEKFIGEIKWYLKLPLDVEYVRPRIFNYSLSYSHPHICMEYYSYRTLHELFLYGDLSAEQWAKIFSKIKFVLDDFSRYKLNDQNLNDSLQAMYLDKTLSRLNKLKSQPNFRNIFNYPVCINGVFYKSLDEVLKTLEKSIPHLLFNIDSFSIIHGDFCFSNIMVDDNFNFIKLIDPRGKFGNYDIYGDSRYEFAKILHSIEGKYDYIIKDLFDLEIQSSNKFNLKILESARKFNLKEIFIKTFDDKLKNNLHEIRLIESLLFFSMIPLHKEDINRQYAMLCTALQLLNKIIPIGA